MACSTVDASAESSTTAAITQQSCSEQTIMVTLHKPATDKAVHWDEGVIDNEHLGKKTSKCCCIYHKPREFGESSSSDDSDDDGDKCDCHEHRVAKKKMKRRKQINS